MVSTVTRKLAFVPGLVLTVYESHNVNAKANTTAQAANESERFALFNLHTSMSRVSASNDVFDMPVLGGSMNPAHMTA